MECHFCKSSVDYYQNSKKEWVVDVVLPDYCVYVSICRKCKKVLNKIPKKDRKRMGWDEVGQIVKNTRKDGEL